MVTAAGGAATRVLYVGGFGRSGSTLLELCLGSLPQVCALGEVVHLWQRGLVEDQLCGCGEPFSTCPFWQQVGDRAFGGWDRLDLPAVLALKESVDRNRFVPALLAPRLRADRDERVQRYVGLYRAIYAAALATSGASVVVDSSKHVSLASCLRWSPELDLRVMHVVRDSRGVAYSWAKQVRRPEITDSVEYMPTYSAQQSAGLWLAHNAMFEALARRGVRRELVRYEDFSDDPTSTIARVAALAGLPAPVPGPDDRAGTVHLSANHTVAGNPMRFRQGAVQVRRDDAWRRDMPAARRRLVTALTAPLLLRYGYLQLTSR
ncbi:MAG: sulfotransferase domain-containing protein [Angustibacter sp.]